MITVEAYSQKAGITPRAVRAKAQRGLIKAHKFGNQWVIEEDPSSAEKLSAGRPLSTRAFNDLALIADNFSPELPPQRKHRAKQRLQQLKVEGFSRFLGFARRTDLDVQYFMLSHQEIAELSQELASQLTGVSNPIAGINGTLVDAYVSREQLEDIVLFYSLSPATKAHHNVRLRVGDVPKNISRLHIAADLYEDATPRSQTRARELFEQVMQQGLSHGD